MLNELNLDLDYTSSAYDLVEDFYEPCLNRSISYDRAAAYFRSSVFHLIGVAISDFALRGGIMRLICSPSFTPEDYATLKETQDLDHVFSESLERDFHSLLQDPVAKPGTELFATLLKLGTLQVKLAYRPSSSGIFHVKLGILVDADGNKISFQGSENETAAAWDSRVNHESFEVFTSWTTEKRERERIERHTRYFENLWQSQIEDLVVTSLPNVPRALIESHANADGIAAAVERVRREFKAVRPPTDSPQKTPQLHQKLVMEHWWREKRGIVDHVTGAGKTLTALWIIRDWLQNLAHAALILVPSSLLAQQWEREIRSELADLDVRLLRVGGEGGSKRWGNLLTTFSHPRNSRHPKVVLATMQTACKAEFLERLTVGRHLLVVADEVHRVGSPTHLSLLKISSGAALGLSATPERFFDPNGTQEIFDYFGPVLEPPFRIVDAQKARRLVPYDFFVHYVTLTESESEEHKKLTTRIGQQYQMTTRTGDTSAKEMLARLLQRRAQILKTAESKVAIAETIMRQNYQKQRGQRWLVYCDNQDQLQAIRKGLSESGIDSLEYTSDMLSALPETLSYFERYGGVLISIHCLDEGVDIPNITHALILASSINPREHLQRRGRVLRRTSGKYSAVIHDALVGTDTDSGFRPFESEVSRAIAFAEDARNASVRIELRRLRQRWLDDKPIAYEQEPATESINEC